MLQQVKIIKEDVDVPKWVDKDELFNHIGYIPNNDSHYGSEIVILEESMRLTICSFDKYQEEDAMKNLSIEWK